MNRFVKILYQAVEGKPEGSVRTLSFGSIGLFFCVAIGVLDYVQQMVASAYLLFGLSLVLLVILVFEYFGYRKYINTAIVISINSFLIAIVMAEGLATGSHYYLLSLLVALSFLLVDAAEDKRKVLGYFLIQVSSFCFCILDGRMVSSVQHINPELYHQKFVMNSICSVVLIAVFAYVGMYFERKVKEDLVVERNKALAQSKKIQEHNLYLREIAFMNAHTLRAPLTNILGLIKRIDIDNMPTEKDKKLQQYLKQSAEELDIAIHTIVAKTNEVEELFKED